MDRNIVELDKHLSGLSTVGFALFLIGGFTYKNSIFGLIFLFAGLLMVLAYNIWTIVITRKEDLEKGARYWFSISFIVLLCLM